MSDFSKLKVKKNSKEYVLNVCTQDTEQNISGTKNFTKLTVNSKNVVTSINGVSPSEDGNVEITTSGTDLSGVVKSVNGIQPDENGNISLVSEDVTTSSEAITIDDNSNNNISLTTASEITVANGTVGKAWSKSVKITNSDSTITLGSSWTWVNGEVPTLKANSLLVLKWCYDYGIAGLVSITG